MSEQVLGSFGVVGGKGMRVIQVRVTTKLASEQARGARWRSRSRFAKDKAPAMLPCSYLASCTPLGSGANTLG